MFSYFFVRLLDYSILLKSRHTGHGATPTQPLVLLSQNTHCSFYLNLRQRLSPLSHQGWMIILFLSLTCTQAKTGLRQDHPRLTSTKKKKCLKDSEESSLVNPSRYLNSITPEGHHEITNSKFLSMNFDMQRFRVNRPTRA